MNRLVTAAILALMLAVPASAKFSLGLDITYSVDRTSTTNGGSEYEEIRSYNSIGVQPYFGIYPNDLIEISPFIGFYSSSSSTENESTNSETSSTQGSMALGCGLYFHVVRGEVFDVSVGPQIGYQPFFKPNTEPYETEYDTYYKANLWIACPFNIDMHFTKYFSARLSTDLIRYNNYNFTTETEGGSETDIHTDEFDLRSIFQPRFGLFFTF